MNEEQAVQVIQDCVADIRSWARQHSLMLNDGKTELLMLGARQQLSKTNTCISHLRVGDATVAASTSVRNLGSYFEKNFTMATHVTKTCSATFFHLHNIRQIRKFLSHEATETLIHAFVTSKIDYCNSLLYGLPALVHGLPTLVTTRMHFNEVVALSLALHLLSFSFVLTTPSNVKKQWTFLNRVNIVLESSETRSY